MNIHDKQNLNFLTTIAQSQHSWNSWCSQASLDDIEYALELLKQYQISLTSEMQVLDQLEDIQDVTAASQLLSRIQLALR
jgi:hypothetical protein